MMTLSKKPNSSPKDEKGRGSYRCGKCGVPKKGHICPYQPKFKRRPDEPAPETKNASTQVEMDEFLVLRRLNLEIQGFPESYIAEPKDNVGAEPVYSHPAVSAAVVGSGMQPQMHSTGVGPGPAPLSHPGAMNLNFSERQFLEDRNNINMSGREMSGSIKNSTSESNPNRGRDSSPKRE